MLDLKDGDFQIPVREEDKYKTAFTINQRKYGWNRMPMGFKNSQAKFQRIMNSKLHEFINKGCNISLGDIVIYGKIEQEHYNNLSKIPRI